MQYIDQKSQKEDELPVCIPLFSWGVPFFFLNLGANLVHKEALLPSKIVLILTEVNNNA